MATRLVHVRATRKRKAHTRRITTGTTTGRGGRKLATRPTRAPRTVNARKTRSRKRRAGSKNPFKKAGIRSLDDYVNKVMGSSVRAGHGTRRSDYAANKKRSLERNRTAAARRKKRTSTSR